MITSRLWPLFYLICSCAPLAKADIITDWNNAILEAIAGQGSTASPPTATRYLAMAHAAAYDAVNSISQSYNPYLNYYTPAGPASAEAAAAQAAHDVLVSLFNGQTLNINGAPVSATVHFGNLLNTQLGNIANGVEKDNGISLGVSAATGMLNARQNDGSNAASTYSPQPLNTPGAWQPPSTGGGAWGVGTGTFLKSEWGNVRTFGIPEGSPGDPDPVGTWQNPNGAYFRPGAPPTLTSAEYTAAFNQVKELGSATSGTRTADQEEIAYFWVDGPGTASPPGHWNRIAQTVGAAMNLSLVESARLFALLGIAEADTAITTWETKREYDLWRPNQAIAQADIDGNAATSQDVNWVPLIPTPSFPAYTSGHSAFSMTGAVILANFYGSDNFAFTTDTESPFLAPGTTRSFSSFSEAADEAGMSRIYGGIHFSFDNTSGQEIGTNVGNYIFSNYLQPVPEPGSCLLLMLSATLLNLRRRKK
jgi:hypothetical protein